MARRYEYRVNPEALRDVEGIYVNASPPSPGPGMRSHNRGALLVIL